MSNEKNVLNSQTVRGLIVVAIGMGLKMFGFDNIPEGEITDILDRIYLILPEIVQVVGLIWALIGRLRATEKLSVVPKMLSR